jgi:hypothetical protein
MHRVEGRHCQSQGRVVGGEACSRLHASLLLVMDQQYARSLFNKLLDMSTNLE